MMHSYDKMSFLGFCRPRKPVKHLLLPESLKEKKVQYEFAF